MIIVITLCSIIVIGWTAAIIVHLLGRRYDKLYHKYLDEYENTWDEYYHKCEKGEDERKKKLHKHLEELDNLKSTYRDKRNAIENNDILSDSSCIFLATLITLLLFAIGIAPAIYTQCFAKKYEVETNMHRDALIADYDAYKSGVTYDTTNIHERIADFNIDLHNTKYWESNPWTSWYKPYTVANIDYIEIDN